MGMNEPGEHLNPTEEISSELVKKRALRGVMTLTGRTFFLNIISLIAQGFLWAFLNEYQFGVFWVVSAIVNFLVYFSDIGLAAALIQKKDRLTQKDLQTTFTVQEILVFILILVLFSVTPVFERTHALPPEGKLLLYSLAFSFFLSSLKTIPSILLERNLEFGKFVIPQILENLFYNLSVVFFAWKGFGITSFSYAVVIRSVVGLVSVYLLRPWKPGISLSKESLKKLLSFGIPYQANTLLAVVKDDGMTILLGSILGPAGMGILGTAQRLSQYPLRFFLDNVTKVTFPAFSRLQNKKEELARVVTKSLFFITFLVFPSIIGLVIISPFIIKVIPRYAKWEPALLPLSLLSINTIFAAATTQLTNLLNSIGKIKIHFKLMLMWTALTILIVPVLSIIFGVNGAAFAFAIISLSSVVAIYISKKYVNFSIKEGILKPLMASLTMGLILLLVRQFLTPSFFSIAFLISLGAFVYLILCFVLVGGSFLEDVQKSIKTFFSK